MRAEQTEACNHSLGAPPGHEESTGALPCRVEDDAEYGQVYRSYWDASAEEIAELARGGHVELTICGDGHPPVAVNVVAAGEPRSRIPAAAPEHAS